jgi:hypothetical protein
MTSNPSHARDENQQEKNEPCTLQPLVTSQFLVVSNTGYTVWHRQKTRHSENVWFFVHLSKPCIIQLAVRHISFAPILNMRSSHSGSQIQHSNSVCWAT